jgi:hypothetical protein
VHNVDMCRDINHATDDVTELESWSTFHHAVWQHCVLSCLSGAVVLATATVTTTTYNCHAVAADTVTVTDITDA